MKNIFDDRRFLNKNGYHSIASICSTIHEDKEDSYFSPLDVELSISDCSRVITLSMDTSNEKDLDNTLFKLQQLIEVCQGTKDCLEQQRGLIKKFEQKKKLEKQKDAVKNE